MRPRAAVAAARGRTIAKTDFDRGGPATAVRSIGGSPSPCSPLRPQPNSVTLDSLPGMSLLRSKEHTMPSSAPPKTLAYLPNFTARKVQAVPGGLPADVADSLAAWATRYLALAVVGVRSTASDAEGRPAPRPLRRLLSSRATVTTASRPACAATSWRGRRRWSTRVWRRRQSTTTSPRSPPSPPGSPPRRRPSSPSAIPPRGSANSACRRSSPAP